MFFITASVGHEFMFEMLSQYAVFWRSWYRLSAAGIISLHRRCKAALPHCGMACLGQAVLGPVNS
jgi:hypothetical protein